MSHPEEYDVVVLGSGRARFFAWSLASQGKRVAVVERRNLAGSCPTIACAPSKNVIHGAKVANYFRRGAELAKIPVAAFIRPWTISESRGFYKTLVAADSDRILGFTAFAPEAGAVMTIVQTAMTAMTARLPYTALRDAILVHPTMAEGLARLFRAVPARR